MPVNNRLDDLSHDRIGDHEQRERPGRRRPARINGGGEDLPVPGAQYGFRTLEAAEAATDLQALRSHGLPAERVTLAGDDPAGAIRALAARIAGLI